MNVFTNHNYNICHYSDLIDEHIIMLCTIYIFVSNILVLTIFYSLKIYIANIIFVPESVDFCVAVFNLSYLINSLTN